MKTAYILLKGYEYPLCMNDLVEDLKKVIDEQHIDLSSEYFDITITGYRLGDEPTYNLIKAVVPAIQCVMPTTCINTIRATLSDIGDKPQVIVCIDRNTLKGKKQE